MAEAAETEGKSAGDEKAKKGPNKMIIIIIAAVVVLAGAGGGGYYFFVRSKAEAKGEEGAEKGKTKGKAAKGEEEAAGEEEDAAADEEAAAEEEPAAKKKGAVKLNLPDDSAVKHIIELQPYVVNLADQEEARYLRLAVSLGIGGEEGGEKEEKPDPLFTTRIRNAMLAVLTSRTSAEVLTNEGKAQLRRDLLRAARAASKEPKVEAIYITEFIVQL